MPERECSNHQTKATVWLDPNKLTSKRHSNLIAALLRSIADYTDGWCATEHAKDADIISVGGMKFWFTSEEKKEEFFGRIPMYLSSIVDAALTTA